MGILVMLVLAGFIFSLLVLPAVALWHWLGAGPNAIFWGVLTSGIAAGYTARRWYWRHQRKLRSLERWNG